MADEREKPRALHGQPTPPIDRYAVKHEYVPRDWSKYDVTDVYEYFPIPPGEPGPRFRIPHHKRDPDQTDKQYEATRRATEQHFRAQGVYLAMSQAAATHRGHFRDCKIAACRRAGKCISRRLEDDWTIFPGPMMPPCCDRKDRTEPVREMIREITPKILALRRREAEEKAKAGGEAAGKAKG